MDFVERLIPPERRQTWADPADTPYRAPSALWPLFLYHPATQIARITALALGYGATAAPWVGVLGMGILLPSWLWTLKTPGTLGDRLQAHIRSLTPGTPKKALREGLTFLVLGLLLTPVVGIVNQAIGGEFGIEVRTGQTQKVLHEAMKSTIWISLWNWIGMGVTIPVLEEWAIRGVLFTWLRRHMGWTWALLLQATVFGVLHGQPGLFLPTAWLGFVCGLAMARSGSILAPILLHIGWNTFILVLVSLAMVP